MLSKVCQIVHFPTALVNVPPKAWRGWGRVATCGSGWVETLGSFKLGVGGRLDGGGLVHDVVCLGLV